MKKASLSIILLIGITLAFGGTQVVAQDWGGNGRFGGHHSLFPFFGPSHSPGHIGLFPVGHRSRPSFFFGGFRTTPLTFRSHRLAWGTGFWAPYLSAYRPELKYTSKKFVEKWANREPVIFQPSSRIEQSLILSRGMSEEEVVETLGSPLQKIQLENREVWKYSSYSLLFESGSLIEIR